MAGDEADLGLGLEPRPDRLPVDAAVMQRDVRVVGPPVGDGATPRRVEAGSLVPFVAVGEREAEVECDEVVGRDEGTDREVTSQAADGRHAQDAVTPGVGEGAARARGG